jgi:phosphoesterase RecJ-like protein
VRVAVLVSQHEPGSTRASFRSKPGVVGVAGEATVDVNAIAARLGGGGHMQAAGAKLAMDLPDAVREVERVVLETMSP